MIGIIFSSGYHWIHTRRFLLRHLRDLGMGHRYDFKDKRVEELMEKFNKIQEKFIYMIIPDFFPFIEYLLPKSILNYLVEKNKRTLMLLTRNIGKK
ncbi:hypothetical protein Anas_05864 [Armadillidium nasatum]|uniref:Uncharacterized protein n=1 Tax=Armadillidium nasatum TaxID=96803 RepID=A0A5N5SRA5_9CRUS|nr:hypothetical protein Anas_05864 [Armadillidium nasatum]